jgi:hypothetical protein
MICILWNPSTIAIMMVVGPKKGTKSESGDTKARARQECLDGGVSGQLGPNLHFVECIGNVDDGCWLKWDRSSRPPRWVK